MDPDMVPSSYGAGAWPLMLPRVRHDRPERPHWEGSRLLSMRHHLNPRDLIIDVGSEMGDLSALYASWGCKVVLAEANPQAWPWARATFDANGLQPEACWWGFVSDRMSSGADGGWYDSPADPWPGCAYNDPEPETGFVTEHERSADWCSMTIDRMTVDGGTVPQAITVDVEGAEFKVMRGAEGTLRGVRPLVWLSEHDTFMVDQGDDPMDLYDFMDGCGYEPRFLAEDHERHVMWLPTERAAGLWPR